MHRFYVLLVPMLLAACGGSSSSPDAEVSDAGGPDGTPPPAECWQPSPPEYALDCELMCKKDDACAQGSDTCLEECAGFAALLSAQAGPLVETCFVDAPCSPYPAVFTLIGCMVEVVDEPGYSPNTANEAACLSIVDKAESCGRQETAEELRFLCTGGDDPDDVGLAQALSAQIFERTAACVEGACETFGSCLNDASCLFDVEPDTAAGDKCSSDSDLAEINHTEPNSSSWYFVERCVSDCYEEPTGDDCVAECFDPFSELSDTCHPCFGGFGDCLMAQCLPQCYGRHDSLACSACLGLAGCNAEFEACSGLDAPLGDKPSTDLCLSDADGQALAHGLGALEAMVACSRQVNRSVFSLTNCMKGPAQLSESCVDCGLGLAVCTQQACEAACEEDGIPCYECLRASVCAEHFEACAGRPLPAPKSGACLADTDVVRTLDGATWTAAFNCPTQCSDLRFQDLKYAECIAACAAEQAGISEGCAGCYGEAGLCAFEACNAECTLAPPDEPPCFECALAQGCLEGFEACAGRPALPVPAGGVTGCADTLACRIGCAGDAGCESACDAEAIPSTLAAAQAAFECVTDTCPGAEWACLDACVPALIGCPAADEPLGCGESGFWSGYDFGIEDCLEPCGYDLVCRVRCLSRAGTAEVLANEIASHNCPSWFCAPNDTPCRDAIKSAGQACHRPEAFCGYGEWSPWVQCADASECAAECLPESGAACTEWCVDQATGEAASKLKALLSCVDAECPGEQVDSACTLDKCLPPLQACVDVPTPQGCPWVYGCLADCGGDEGCAQTCLGAAKSSQTATAATAVAECVASVSANLLDDALEVCPETMIAPPLQPTPSVCATSACGVTGDTTCNTDTQKCVGLEGAGCLSDDDCRKHLCKTQAPAECEWDFAMKQCLHEDWYLNAQAEYPGATGSCSDGLDNDCDGRIDAEDASCGAPCEGIESSCFVGDLAPYGDGSFVAPCTTGKCSEGVCSLQTICTVPEVLCEPVWAACYAEYQACEAN